jgi:hypothetical protein
VTDTPSTEALAEAAQRIVAMFDGNPVIEPSSAFAEAIAGLRDTLTAIPAPNGLADRFSKQAKDAAAIHDAFHDGVASAFREAAREVRAALEGATERPLDVERLADAMREFFDWQLVPLDIINRDARAVASIYARLVSPTTTTPEAGS